MKKRIIACLIAVFMVFGVSLDVGAVSITLGNVFANAGDSSIPSLVSKLSPSVVGIIGKLKESSPDYDEQYDNLVFGTGVIYKSNGYIVTNAHVVNDMEKIVVVLSNGKAYQARLKASDEMTDLALIKIDKGRLTPAQFGDVSDIIVGEEVLAIGTPMSFSLRNSVTKGIISGLNRSVEGEYRLIQSDAAINEGNSGGPLINSAGKVIGINTIKFSGIGVEGMSFSIPIDTVKYALNQFEKYLKIKRPYLGVEFSEGVAAAYGLPSNEGLTVISVDKQSPADLSGILEDDVIIEINGSKMSTKIDYYEKMKSLSPGDTAVLKIERSDKIIFVNVTFDEKN